jgi:hypothetical protein
MGLNYISYQEAERLFEVWPILKQIKQSSAMELKLIEGLKNNAESVDEWIYTLSVGNKIIDGLPHPKTTSNPTERVAIEYSNAIAKDIFNSNNEIRVEIMLLCLIDEKLKIAFDGLTQLQQTILKLFYWQKMTWSEILSQLAEQEKEFISKRQAQMQRKDAIQKMAITSRITEKVYTDVMKIIDRGVGKK